MPQTSLPDIIYKACLTSGRFRTKDREVIASELGKMPLSEVAQIKGIGNKRVVTYAKWAGRDAELLSLDSVEFPHSIDPDEGRKAIFLDRLKQEFEATTFNDEINLEYLAELYVQRWNLSKAVMSSTDSDATRAAQQINANILALEKHLQIDPQTRAEQAAAADPAAIIGDWVDQSALYMADEAVIHSTEHGPAGYTIWHFKTPEYMPRCASCGHRHFVFRSPWDELDHSFEVATEAQLKRYVRGRDFTPEGAPNLSIFEEKPL